MDAIVADVASHLSKNTHINNNQTSVIIQAVTYWSHTPTNNSLKKTPTTTIQREQKCKIRVRYVWVPCHWHILSHTTNNILPRSEWKFKANDQKKAFAIIWISGFIIFIEEEGNVLNHTYYTNQYQEVQRTKRVFCLQTSILSLCLCIMHHLNYTSIK